MDTDSTFDGAPQGETPQGETPHGETPQGEAGNGLTPLGATPESAMPEAYDPSLTADILSVPQEIAVQELARGKSAAACARAAGVSRATFYRWMASPPFIARVNAWRANVMELVRNRLFAAAEDAAITLREAIRAGDTHAAIVLLKEMGILSPIVPGSEDPAIVARELETKRREEMARLDRREARMPGKEAKKEQLRQRFGGEIPPEGRSENKG